MRRRQFMLRLGFSSVGALALVLAGSVAVAAQGREAPNDEPSSFDTLFDQSDLGNVAQKAKMDYGAGMRDLKRADTLTARQGELNEKKRASGVKKIAASYARAVESFKSALGLNPKFTEAYVGLAAAFRGLGKHPESLLVVSQGLQVAPEEETLLGEWARSLAAIDMAEDAPRAYASLVESSPTRAAILMGAMKEWVAEHGAAAGTPDPEDVARLRAWIAWKEGAA